MSEHERQQLLAALQKKLIDLAGGAAGKESLAQERSCDPLDEAQAELNLNVVVRRLSLDWETRRAILAALERVRSGDYGTCENCGAPIHAKRLEAVPWATLCVACQAAAENQQATEDPEPETIQ
jgi:RNA polymerase-binding transcription factor